MSSLRRSLALVALAALILGCDALATASPSAGPASSSSSASSVASVASEPAPASPGPTAGAAASRAGAPTAPASPAAAVSAGASGAAPVPSAGPTPAPAAQLLVGDGKWHEYTVNGRSMAIACSGRGTQPVILEHGIGYGVDSASWRTVMSAVAKFAFVCRYDRLFTGRSDPGASGRSLSNVAAEMRALLRAAKIQPPYVLVGHSFGAITTRYYAATFPGEVAAIVLVDGTHQQFLGEFTLASERLNEARVIADAKKLGSLGKRPLVVLTRGIGAGTRWQAAQKALAKLSTNAKQVIATGSGHFIQTSKPDLVVTWIQRALTSARTGKPL